LRGSSERKKIRLRAYDYFTLKNLNLQEDEYGVFTGRFLRFFKLFLEPKNIPLLAKILESSGV
jgi:hypothetical protein